MLGGQPNHGWELCFPLYLHAGGSETNQLALPHQDDCKTRKNISVIITYVEILTFTYPLYTGSLLQDDSCIG